MDQHWMDAEARARGILAMWDQGDLAALDAALRSAERVAAEGNGLSAEEEERLELLDGIVGHLRRDMAHTGSAGIPDTKAETYRRLLRHLAGGGYGPAIPPEKPSFFPY